MEYSGLLRPFRNKVLSESIARSLLFALITCGLSVFCLSLVYHILVQQPSVATVVAVGGAAFAAGFAARLAMLFPSEKKLARRMDDAGLEERVITMVDLKKEQSEMAGIQRNDAVKHIEGLSTKKLSFSLKKWEWILCLVSVFLAVAMLLLPLNIFSPAAGEDIADAERQQAIRDFIQTLRDEVKKSALSDELKEEIDGIIDELEDDLENTDSELQQAAEIEQAKSKIDALLKAALTKDKIGEALQKYGLTRELGEAVSDGDTERVATELDALEKTLNEDTEQIAVLSGNISDALAASGVDSSDDLYTAFAYFSADLAAVDKDSAGIEKELEEIFDTAEKAIVEALEEQNAIAAEKAALDKSMSDAKDEVLGNEKEDEGEESGEGEKPEGEESGGEKPDGKQPDGEKPDGERPEGETPDGMQEGGSGEGEEGGDIAGMTEGLYDPASGKVKYGEVFAAYYAEYLAALEAGEVSEEMQEIIDNYFSSLN